MFRQNLGDFGARGRVSAAPSRLARARGPARPRLPLARQPARPRSPAGASGRTAQRALPGAAPAPPAGRALCAPAARPPASPCRLRLVQPSHGRELAAGSSGSSRGRLCCPQRSQAAPPRAEEEAGEEKLVRVPGRLRTLSKYLLNE